jgi:hypothetical protein
VGTGTRVQRARAASKFRELRVSGLQHKVVGGARTQASHLLLLNSHAWSPKKIRCKMAGDAAGQDTPCEIDSEPVCMHTSSAPVIYSARLDLVVLGQKLYCVTNVTENRFVPNIQSDLQETFYVHIAGVLESFLIACSETWCPSRSKETFARTRTLKAPLVSLISARKFLPIRKKQDPKTSFWPANFSSQERAHHGQAPPYPMTDLAVMCKAHPEGPSHVCSRSPVARPRNSFRISFSETSAGRETGHFQTRIPISVCKITNPLARKPTLP